MYGSRQKDDFTVMRDIGIPAFTSPNNIRLAYTLPVQGSPKLTGLYNSYNMPVIYSKAGQKNAFMAKQAGVKNNNLALIAQPERMPYVLR